MIISGPDGGSEDYEYDPFEPRDSSSSSSSGSSSTTTTTTTSSPADRTSIRGGSSSPSGSTTTTNTNDEDNMTHEDPHMDYLYRRMENRSSYESKRLNSRTDIQGGQENFTVRSAKVETKNWLEEHKELAVAGAVAVAIVAFNR